MRQPEFPAGNGTDRELARRRRLRLEGYDYGHVGLYFVTICTGGRVCNLSRIVEGEAILLRAGEVVTSVWDSLPKRFSGVEIDAFVVMPNHVHGILAIETCGHPAPGAMNRAPTRERTVLGQVVRTFKGASTRLARLSGVADFAWQANFYEHIVRDDRNLGEIRTYVEANPAKWDADEFFM